MRALIKRRTYLGDIVDYLASVGGMEIRIQKPRRGSSLAAGEQCRLVFNKARWFPAN